MQTKITGLSFLEIMGILALIAILSTIAVPMYSKYTVKSKIVAIMPTLKTIANKIIVGYEENDEFSAISLGNISFTPNAQWILLNQANIKSVRWNGSLTDNNTPRALLSVALYGLDGIPDYVNPTLEQTAKSALHIYIYQKNNKFNITCGQWGVNNSTNDIPLEYLPTECQCTNLETAYLNGSEDETC